MKSPLTLLLVLLVALIPISRALASCTPKATFLSEEYQGCPILKKSSRWRANWPDATPMSSSQVASARVAITTFVVTLGKEVRNAGRYFTHRKLNLCN